MKKVVIASALGLLVLSLGSSGCTKTVIQSGGASSGAVEPESTAERRETIPCKTGETTLPVQAYDINPAESEGKGKVCDGLNVLDDDGSVAGIDWDGTAPHKLAGRDVGGCVAVEFGDGITITSLTMKMRPTSSACGHACTEGDDGCGLSARLSLFAGPSFKELEYLQELSLSSRDLFEYRVAVYDRFKANFIAVCRDAAHPATGDDIAIDSIYGFCK